MMGSNNVLESWQRFVRLFDPYFGLHYWKRIHVALQCVGMPALLFSFLFFGLSKI